MVKTEISGQAVFISFLKTDTWTIHSVSRYGCNYIHTPSNAIQRTRQSINVLLLWTVSEASSTPPEDFIQEKSKEKKEGITVFFSNVQGNKDFKLKTPRV